jgi:hypothetical protein
MPITSTEAPSVWSNGSGSGSVKQVNGSSTEALGINSLASGTDTYAFGPHSHTEGLNSRAIGQSSHAEGDSCVAIGAASSVKGKASLAGKGFYELTIIDDDNISFVGDQTSYFNIGDKLRTLGDGVLNPEYTITNIVFSLGFTTITVSSGTFLALDIFLVCADQSVENCQTAEGYVSMSSGVAAHAEGQQTKAIGNASHAEGSDTTASGNASHAEGRGTISSGSYSHSEGYLNEASGIAAHAEGRENEASGLNSHAEGRNTKSVGIRSHSEGEGTIADGDWSHAGGVNAKAFRSSEWTRSSSNRGQYGVVSLSAFSNTNHSFEFFIDESNLKFNIPIDTSYRINIDAIVTDVNTGDSKEWGGVVIIKNFNNTTSLTGAATMTSVLGDASLNTATLTVSADDTNDYLKIQGAGITGKDLNWFVKVTYTSVKIKI